MEAFIRFAELALLDIAGTWQMASPENRQRVQIFCSKVVCTTQKSPGF